MKISAFVSIVTLGAALALSAFKSNLQPSPKRSRRTTFNPILGGAEGQHSDTILFPGEKHFANVQQLTFGGDNAEAYFSFDSKYLIYQRKNEKQGIPCDQIWMGKIPTQPGEKFQSKLVSTGTGRTTCSYFYPDGKTILFGDTLFVFFL